MNILNADNSKMMCISRERTLSLNLNEMRKIQSHFATLQRKPTDVEFETILSDLVTAIERSVNVSVESARSIDDLPTEITSE